jgi:hypothetical protein
MLGWTANAPRLAVSPGNIAVFAPSCYVAGVKEKGATEDEAPQALPPLDFSTFILSLASTAMIHLGQVPGPEGDSLERDLPAAKQAIDMLGMLEEKTRGNLDDAEAKLLKSLIYDLRVAYVDAQKQR